MNRIGLGEIDEGGEPRSPPRAKPHSVGWRQQLLNLITYAIGVNAISMHVHRQGLAPPLAA